MLKFLWCCSLHVNVNEKDRKLFDQGSEIDIWRSLRNNLFSHTVDADFTPQTSSAQAQVYAHQHTHTITHTHSNIVLRGPYRQQQENLYYLFDSHESLHTYVKSQHVIHRKSKKGLRGDEPSGRTVQAHD